MRNLILDWLVTNGLKPNQTYATFRVSKLAAHYHHLLCSFDFYAPLCALTTKNVEGQQNIQKILRQFISKLDIALCTWCSNKFWTFLSHLRTINQTTLGHLRNIYKISGSFFRPYLDNFRSFEVWILNYFGSFMDFL